MANWRKALAFWGLLSQWCRLSAGFWSRRRQGSHGHGDGILAEDVVEAEDEWAKGVVEIADLLGHRDEKGARKEADRFVAQTYAFERNGGVLLRPFDAPQRPFRSTREGVVSWLIGSTEEFPEDDGFTRQPLRRVRFQNVQICIHGDQAIAVGMCFITTSHSLHPDDVRVDFTTVYSKHSDGHLRIYLQFWSLPFRRSFEKVDGSGITPQDIDEAQTEWRRRLTQLSDSYADGQHKLWDMKRQAPRQAQRFVDDMFVENFDRLLFKPAEAVEGQEFRTDHAGVLAYLLGGSRKFPDDMGLVRKAWRRCTFENRGFILEQENAWAMGRSQCEGTEGGMTEVADYSFGYMLDDHGHLRVHLYHASSDPSSDREETGLSVFEHKEDSANEPITEQEIREAQREWCKQILQLGEHHRGGSDLWHRGAAFVDEHYAFSHRPVALKLPDLVRRSFRTSREGAISYFVGGDHLIFPEDRGFAKHHGPPMQIENEGILLFGSQAAVAVGRLLFSDEDGLEHSLDIATGFMKDSAGRLCINLQHMSYPGKKLQQRSGEVYEGKLATTRASRKAISRREIRDAQERWGKHIVEIGQVRKDKERAHARAEELVDALYGFSDGPVLIKPTGHSGSAEQRSSREGAISFLVGGDREFPADRGFALEPWERVEFKEHAFRVMDNRAEVMGSCSFSYSTSSRSSAPALEMEYTFVYFRDREGTLRLRLQHLSQPYQGPGLASWMRNFGSSFTSPGLGALLLFLLLAGVVLCLTGGLICLWYYGDDLTTGRLTTGYEKVAARGLNGDGSGSSDSSTHEDNAWGFSTLRRSPLAASM